MFRHMSPLCGGSRGCRALDGLDEEPAPVCERVCLPARELEQVAIAAERCEAQAERTGLARAQQLALAADLEIALGEVEAVVRLDHRLQSRARRVGQLLLRARDEQAVGLLAPAPDPAAKLVQLREPEAIRLLDDHHRR